jgi:proline dehydrogenase
MSLFHKIVSNTIDYVPPNIVSIFAKKYIAGAYLEDALNLTKAFNRNGIMSTIDVLGEDVKKIEEANFYKNECIKVLEEIKSNNLNANLSLKPTQMGFALSKSLGFNNIREIVKRAYELDNFVRIDMENSPYTTDTIEMYKQLRKEFGQHVGTVLQAYMRRTIDDIEYLSDDKMNIRLCKGIYIEPEKIAYKNRDIIVENYKYCLEELFKKKAYVGIATHDEKLVFYAMKLIKDYNLHTNEYEFQMLLVVGENLKQFILDKNHRLRIYVPYGIQWLAYAKRRLKENPNIIKTALHLG